MSGVGATGVVLAAGRGYLRRAAALSWAMSSRLAARAASRFLAAFFELEA
jgi:hypothetical protein